MVKYKYNSKNELNLHVGPWALAMPRPVWSFLLYFTRRLGLPWLEHQGVRAFKGPKGGLGSQKGLKGAHESLLITFLDLIYS